MRNPSLPFSFAVFRVAPQLTERLNEATTRKIEQMFTVFRSNSRKNINFYLGIDHVSDENRARYEKLSKDYQKVLKKNLPLIIALR